MRGLKSVLAAGLLLSGGTAQAQRAERIEGGVAITPAAGTAARVVVTVHGEGIFHVVATPREMLGEPVTASLMAPAPPKPGAHTIAVSGGRVLIKAKEATADIDLGTGTVRFLDPAGSELLAQAHQPAFAATSADGQRFVSVSQQFNRGSEEGLYGLGQHQNQQMDLNGEDLELAQHNMDIAIPFLVSTRGYGILWDNNSITRFGNPAPYGFVGEGGVKVTSGGKPGFTAQYFLGDRLAVTQREAVIDYQYIDDQAKWPEGAKAQTVAAETGQNTAGNAIETQRVVWTGELTADATGTHKFQLYGSSYFKLWMDGKLALDRWRQNWNPWYSNFDHPMIAGKPVKLRIEWEPNAGYMAFLHSSPLPPQDRKSIWMTSEVGRAVDYWFVPGGRRGMDGAIAGYRQLTGKAVMLPKWAYGFWQSRQRYETQDQLLGVVEEYRKRRIPLDNIVQDWFYWPENAWGSHDFDAARFPDPKGMVDRVHALNARFMISVWPKFYPTTEHYKELAAAGHVYLGNLEMGNKDWVGPGYLNTDYDPYSPEARAIYWRQMKDKLAVLGTDAWWMDATEPDIHSNLSIENRIRTMGPTAMGPAAQFFNSFPLVHAEGVYEGWRAWKPEVRPFILTRSGFGGIQRTASALWSGDVASRWYDLRAQISAGASLSMSGVPNWTHDIGGFALENRFSAPQRKPQDLDEWRELNLRWLQFGAFSPLFRSHGEAPKREIHEISPEGSPMRASMVWHTELRYRLMPWWYSLAAATWFEDASIMRGLAMDFPDDRHARAIDDQYLLGRELLVAPVSEYKARERQVYLPALPGGWWDFHTGARHRGGETITVAAPYERMPLFVRAGSIIAMGPVRQYVDEKPEAPLTLLIYPGADGAFTLHEDDGVSESYREGHFRRIPMAYDDASGTIRIGSAEGKGYHGMPARRAIRVRWIQANRALDLDGPPDVSVQWSGSALVIPKPR